MQTLSETAFLEWAGSQGLQLDPRYPHSAVLTFRDASPEARFWEVPAEPYRRPHFILSLLNLLGDWQSCYAWRHLGRWPASADPLRINDVVEFQILKGLGLPLGTADVVAFSREELSQLVTLMFATTIFGGSVADDLYVVPDHGRALLQTDHHDVIHVVCRDPADIRAWITGMAASDFILPDEVPDETFKLPRWMRAKDKE